MSSTRRDPFRDVASLRDAMNTLFEDSMVRPKAGIMALTGSVPVDVKETRTAYVILMPLPGVSPNDVDIAVLGSTVRVSGELRDLVPEEFEEDVRWLIREWRMGRFERSITLPTTVNPERASAKFDNGVLTIRLPKAEEATPKTIPVRASES